MEIMGIDSVEVSNRERGGKEAIDREKVCPFLLRCFWVCNKRPNSAREYNARDNRGEFFKVPPNEVKIYVWRNSTLREISHLLQDYIPPSRHPESVTEYGVVYPDRYGDNVLKFLGKVHIEQPKNTPLDDGEATLSSLGVEPGDFLDVHVDSPDRLQQPFTASIQNKTDHNINVNGNGNNNNNYNYSSHPLVGSAGGQNRTNRSGGRKRQRTN